MIRTTNYILKYSNQNKIDWLTKLYCDYKHDLQLYIDLILTKQLPLKALLSSKELKNIGIIKHSQWSQVIYKQASENIRGQIQLLSKRRYSRFKKCYRYFYKNQRQLNFLNKRYSDLNLKILWPKQILIKNISINIDERLIDIQKTNNHFDEFINLKLPYFHLDKKRAIQIKLPIKHHKHSLKYWDWNQRKTIQLKYTNNNFYFKVFFEREPIKSTGTKNIAFDLGYNKLIADSDGKTYGQELKDIYIKINNKLQRSKNFKQTLVHRNNKINETINKIDLSTINNLYVEDLKNVFYKKKYKQNMKRWTYSKVLNKLSLVCEDNGINLIKVNPAYTSQTCSRCGTIDEESRNGELYQCSTCNLEMDVDINAAINILRRGVYNPSSIKESKNVKEQ